MSTPRHEPALSWLPLGRAFERGIPGTPDFAGASDPCVVWDAPNNQWLMLYTTDASHDGKFLLSCGMAVTPDQESVGAGDWLPQGKVTFVNPEMLWSGNPHQPWILMDAQKPHQPALLQGQYTLFFTNIVGRLRVIQRAFSQTLRGPWRVQKQPVVAPDALDGFDGYWCCAPSAYWFAPQQQVLIFYQGIPQAPQHHSSPLGSVMGGATLSLHAQTAHKLGPLILPSSDQSNWTAGWVGSMQLLPNPSGGWNGLLCAGPTPAADMLSQPYVRTPHPALCGWTHSDLAFPVGDWAVANEPITWIHALPNAAFAMGEQVNMKRAHMLHTHTGHRYAYYASGAHASEDIYVHELPEALPVAHKRERSARS